MTLQDIKGLRVTELRKVLKNIIVWDTHLVQKCSREIIIQELEGYENPSSPKHGLLLQNLKSYNTNNL